MTKGNQHWIWNPKHLRTFAVPECDKHTVSSNPKTIVGTVDCNTSRLADAHISLRRQSRQLSHDGRYQRKMVALNLRQFTLRRLRLASGTTQSIDRFNVASEVHMLHMTTRVRKVGNLHFTCTHQQPIIS